MINDATQLRTLEKDLTKLGINSVNKPVIQEAKLKAPLVPTKPAASKEVKHKDKKKDDKKNGQNKNDHNKDHRHFLQ